MTANSDQQAPHGEARAVPGTEAAPAHDTAAPHAPAGEHQPHTPTPQPANVVHTRLGGLWLMLSLGAAILVLLLVFILMNTATIEIHIYGAHWNAPLGVALLMASALGVLLVLVPGGGRIIQLKRAARKLHLERESLATRLDEATADVPVTTPPTTPAG
jgi:uncharacterized integral membrane protein